MSQEDEKTGRFGDTSEQVIGACIEVHRHLGPGLLESEHVHCLAHELSLRGLQFKRQCPFPVVYKGVRLGGDTRASAERRARGRARATGAGASDGRGGERRARGRA